MARWEKWRGRGGGWRLQVSRGGGTQAGDDEATVPVRTPPTHPVALRCAARRVQFPPLASFRAMWEEGGRSVLGITSWAATAPAAASVPAPSANGQWRPRWRWLWGGRELPTAAGGVARRCFVFWAHAPSSALGRRGVDWGRGSARGGEGGHRLNRQPGRPRPRPRGLGGRPMVGLSGSAPHTPGPPFFVGPPEQTHVECGCGVGGLGL